MGEMEQMLIWRNTMNKFLIKLMYGVMVTFIFKPVPVLSAQSFLGISFNEPLVVEKCEGYVNKNICSFKNDDGSFKYDNLWKGKSINIFIPNNTAISDLARNGISIHLKENDIVERISFGTRGYDFQYEILKILMKKYGKPNTKNKKLMRNAFNTKYEVISASWQLRDVEVNFKGVEADDPDWGSVTIYTNDMAKRLSDKKRAEGNKKLKL